MNNDMKENFKNKAISLMGKGIYSVAKAAAGSKSLIITYEPKIPESLKGKRNESDI